MPGGSDYPGPQEALDRYRVVVAAADVELKGAKNPYTSLNGHMFSFLDADGTLALRLSDELAEEFLALYDSGPVEQYGRVMRGYVSMADELLADVPAASAWFRRSHDWIATLKPKPTKR